MAAVTASKSSLAHLLPGQPAAKLVANGFYIAGETAEFRAKCLSGDWAAATDLMAARLVSKFDATPAYAAYWAGATVDRYKRDGTPLPPARRAKASPDEPAPKKAKHATPEPRTLDAVIDMVRRANGELSVANGVVTVTINGHEVASGTIEGVGALYNTVARVVTVGDVAAAFRDKYVAAGKTLAAFLNCNADAFDVMGLSRDQYVVEPDPALQERVKQLVELVAQKEQTIATLVANATMEPPVDEFAVTDGGEAEED